MPLTSSSALLSNTFHVHGRRRALRHQPSTLGSYKISIGSFTTEGPQLRNLKQVKRLRLVRALPVNAGRWQPVLAIAYIRSRSTVTVATRYTLTVQASTLVLRLLSRHSGTSDQTDPSMRGSGGLRMSTISMHR